MIRIGTSGFSYKDWEGQAIDTARQLRLLLGLDAPPLPAATD